MQCHQTHYVGNSLRTEQCQNEGTLLLWCPTWTTAGEGPIHICARCARNFMPEHNKNATGEFYWGEKANEKFREIGDSRATRF